MNLWQMKVGQVAKLTNFSQEISDTYKLRLIDLGLQKGATISCVRMTPFAGPRVYMVSGSVLALDKDIAQVVEVAVS